MTLAVRLRTRWLLVSVALVVVGFGLFGIVGWRARSALRWAQEQESAESNLKFSMRPLMPGADGGFGWVSAPASFTEATEFQGRLYVAGSSGLFEFDAAGRPLREFRVGRELPPAPLVRVARAVLAGAHEQELVIATDGAGVLAFDGAAFRQLLPEQHELRYVTAILPAGSGHLLIGTAKRGLLLFDGQRLSPFHSTLKQIHVTELAGSEADLWVGTLDRGVAHWHGGSVEWFNENNGLPDARVYAIAVDGERTYVGGPAGVAEFNAGRYVRTLAAGAFVRSLLPQQKSLLAATMDDGIVEIPFESRVRNVSEASATGELPGVQQLFGTKETLYAVAADGVYSHGASGGWKRVLEPAGGMLTDRNVSALAVDSQNRLWVGYFDRGLDIVQQTGEHARHYENDHLFCVNRIRPNALRGATAIATANGLVLLDANTNRKQVLGKADGLIADHVTDLATYRDGVVLATPAGLTFMDSEGTRSLYAFHGLVNNHVYTVAVNGPYVLAGTLGGVSLLEGDRVRANYTTATSALKHNWITAAVQVGNDWWLGTYGAGIARMDAAGKFERADAASGDLVINPNAMVATDRLVLAGSAGRGLWVMDRKSGRWFAVTEGLPSLNVTALAAANGAVYVGTDNGLLRIEERKLER